MSRTVLDQKQLLEPTYRGAVGPGFSFGSECKVGCAMIFCLVICKVSIRVTSTTS